MKSKAASHAACLLLAGLALGTGGCVTGSVKEAAYKVERTDRDFQVRQYAPQIVAETLVDGTLEEAGNKAFRPLFNYISGANQSKNKIAMTAPVAQQREGEKIAMTAPVTVEPKEGGWRLHFVMPSTESLDTLPQPRNPEVIVRQLPAQDVVAIRFSGWTTEASIESHTVRLQAWMAQRNLKAASSPQVARYNDPFTLPWRRRNEILIPVAQ